MSSHREAPGISKDPVADSTDLYAFTSPDHPDTVTLIANYIPLEGPDGGPNFYNFGDDVLYEITRQQRRQRRGRDHLPVQVHHRVHRPEHLPLQHRPDHEPDQLELERAPVLLGDQDPARPHRSARQPARMPAGQRRRPLHPELRTRSPRRPCIPSMAGGCSPASVVRASTSISGRSSTSASCVRSRTHHLIPLPAVGGVDSTKQLNVHTIAIQIPKTHLTRGGELCRPIRPRADSVIGVYTSASRRKSTVLDSGGRTWTSDPGCRSRASACRSSTRWSSRSARRTSGTPPSRKNDAQFVANYAHPELAGLLPVLYPGVFPNLAAYTKPRASTSRRSC